MITMFRPLIQKVLDKGGYTHLDCANSVIKGLLKDYDAKEAELQAQVETLRTERINLAVRVAELEEHWLWLRDYFEYGQGPHIGMQAVMTSRCTPSVWKEIKRRADVALEGL